MRIKYAAAILLASAVPIAPASAAVIAEYKFDGSGADSSGNGNNATLTNGATFGAGRFGQALKLDGINDFAAAAFPNLTLSAFTVEAWINVPTYGSNVHYVSLVQGSNYLVLGDYGSGVISTWASGLSPVSLNAGSASLSTNAWHHTAFSWDGVTEKVYIDGALAADSSTSGSLKNSTGETHGLVIGARYSKDTQFVSGLIDNVRISDRALAQSELGFFQDGATAAVPEPATWSLMILGFGAMGYAMRRRAKVRTNFA